MNQPDPANLNEPFGDSEQLPPAEAQPVAWMRRAARYRGVDGRQEGERIISESKVHDDDVPLYAHPSPSAPVGVEELIEDLESGLAEDKRDGASEAAIRVQEIIIDQLRALAQQPAAAGEEIMVNAAHDVYTLPLQPSGLSSGPRFVVHVPGPEQPAAVDEAMVERAARAWCAGTDTPFDQLPDAGKARCLEDMRVVLTAALAAQQEGEA